MAMSNDNKKGEQLEILTSTSETHTGAGAGDNDNNDDNDDNNADNTNDTNDTNDGNVANDKEDNCNQEQLQNKFDEIPMKDSESTVDATDAVGSGELVYYCTSTAFPCFLVAYYGTFETGCYPHS
jgi:hypothetical protein